MFATMTPKAHYRPALPDRNLSTTRTHTTSLSRAELSLVLQLSLFSVAWPQLMPDEELKKQLYRFGYFINPPDALKWPRKWKNGAGLPNGSLAETIDIVRQLLARPDALKRLPPPLVIIGSRQNQSPLFTKLPPELRTRIFELALTREDSIAVPTGVGSSRLAIREQARKAMPPTITQTCRLARSEALPIFFRLNEFLLDTNYIDAHGPSEQWLNTMRPSLEQCAIPHLCAQQLGGRQPQRHHGQNPP